MNHDVKRWLGALKESAVPTIDECVASLCTVFPYLDLLKVTEQDPEWHGEGDVHIHTGMVLDELYMLLQKEAAYIQGERRQALILGVLFHDIAKPVCTRRRDINGIERVVSPQHESVGRSYLAYKLMGLGLSYTVVDWVLGLVGEHHIPKRLVVNDAGEGEYLALSRRADCELLYFLERADMSGRYCPDKRKQLEYLAVFKLFCLEYRVWWPEANAYQHWQNVLRRALVDFDVDTQDLIYGNAIRDKESGLITMPEEALAKSYRYRNQHAQLVIMCGPSGSGKTRWIKKNLPDYHVVSLDDIRQALSGDRTNQKIQGQVLQEAKLRLKRHLASHHKVVWDATGLRKDFRTQVCDFGYAYQALVTLVVFQQPESMFFEGNRHREYAVPEAVLSQQIKSMEWPTRDEAHRYVVIDSNHTTACFYGGLQPRPSPF